MDQTKLSHRRWFALAAAIITLALVGVGVTPGSASAVVPTGTNQAVYKGPSSSYGEATWDQVTDNLPSLEAHPGGAFAVNACLATIFDWATASGHFDARIAKTCKSSIHIDVASTDSVQAGSVHRWLTGMQRFGTCYGPFINTNTVATNCANLARRHRRHLRCLPRRWPLQLLQQLTRSPPTREKT